MHNLQFLPVEVQTSIAELRALNVPESALALLVERITRASEAKTNSLQMDVIRIEESIGKRVDRIGEKLRADLRTQHGETNGMLIDIRSSTQQQEAAVEALRADFQSFGEAVSERLTGVERRMDASEADRKDIHDVIEALNTRHGGQITQIAQRLLAIERLLEIAGNHHHDEPGG